jgi:hypothetical protein
MNLYQIADEHSRIVEILEMDEWTPELQEELDEIVAAGDDKLKACYHVYANKRAVVDGIDAELKRIQAIKKANDNSMERLKKSIEAFMKLTGRDRFEDGVVKMILAKKTVFSYDSFPADFIEEVITNKEKLAEFKAWAKMNQEEAWSRYGAEFTDDKAIQIK